MLDVAIATFVIVLVLVVCIVWLDHYFFVTKGKLYEERVASVKNPVLLETLTRENGLLMNYGVVNKEQGHYRIPVEEAMRNLSNNDYERRKRGN